MGVRMCVLKRDDTEGINRATWEYGSGVPKKKKQILIIIFSYKITLSAGAAKCKNQRFRV